VTEAPLSVYDSDAVSPVAALGIAHAVRVGNTVHISGMVSVDAEGNLVGDGDIEAQTRRCYEQIETLLAEMGGSLSNIVKITTFLVNTEDFAPMTAVRREVFSHGHRPASSAIVVGALVFPGALIEIEAVGVLAT
jgi:enamine deaminase RidA (YjgF/YER057c/UK114 family)